MRQRNKDPERWLLQKRGGQGPSAATSALLKTEPLDGSLGSGSGQSLGPGGRRLRTVVNGAAGLFGDDEEDGQSRGRDLGQDADYDEVPYHEDFADDEEKVLPEDHQEDELEKEMEVRTVYDTAFCELCRSLSGTFATRVHECQQATGRGY
jgi:transcription initiation factor TFIIF subunit alpha